MAGRQEQAGEWEGIKGNESNPDVKIHNIIWFTLPVMTKLPRASTCKASPTTFMPDHDPARRASHNLFPCVPSLHLKDIAAPVPVSVSIVVVVVVYLPFLLLVVVVVMVVAVCVLVVMVVLMMVLVIVGIVAEVYR